MCFKEISHKGLAECLNNCKRGMYEQVAVFEHSLCYIMPALKTWIQWNANKNVLLVVLSLGRGPSSTGWF